MILQSCTDENVTIYQKAVQNTISQFGNFQVNLGFRWLFHLAYVKQNNGVLISQINAQNTVNEWKYPSFI